MCTVLHGEYIPQLLVKLCWTLILPGPTLGIHLVGKRCQEPPPAPRPDPAKPVPPRLWLPCHPACWLLSTASLLMGSHKLPPPSKGSGDHWPMVTFISTGSCRLCWTQSSGQLRECVVEGPMSAPTFGWDVCALSSIVMYRRVHIFIHVYYSEFLLGNVWPCTQGVSLLSVATLSCVPPAGAVRVCWYLPWKPSLCW